MLEACFDLIVPLVVSAIIDNGIKTNDTSYVLKMGGVLVLLAFVGLAFSITAQYFAAKASAGFGQELRHELFSHIQKLSYTNVDKYGASTFITRMTADAEPCSVSGKHGSQTVTSFTFYCFRCHDYGIFC